MIINHCDICLDIMVLSSIYSQGSHIIPALFPSDPEFGRQLRINVLLVFINNVLLYITNLM